MEEFTPDEKQISIAKTKTLNHSRDLVHYVNRTQTYPSNNSRSLALYIADYYNPQKGYAFPSQGQMAQDFQTHRPTIIRWIKEIESTGYWDVIKTGKDNSTRYSPSKTEMKKIEEFLKAESKNERVNNKNPRIQGKESRNPQFIENFALKTIMDKPQDYAISPLPKNISQNLTQVRKFMKEKEVVKFKMPAEASKVTILQKEIIALMMSYLIHAKIIDNQNITSTAKLMVDTWVSHPNTDDETFYNRFMHYLHKDKP